MIDPELVREAHTKVMAATTTANENKDAVEKANITIKDREIVRAHLLEAAEHIRKNYGLKIPVIRSFLHEMVDVSI